MHKMSKESANTIISLQSRLDKAEKKIEEAEDLIKLIHAMLLGTIYDNEDIKKQINTYWGNNNEKKI